MVKGIYPGTTDGLDYLSKDAKAMVDAFIETQKIYWDEPPTRDIEITVRGFTASRLL